MIDKTYRAVVGVDASISKTGLAVYRRHVTVAPIYIRAVETKERGQDHLSRAERMYESAQAINSRIPYDSLVLLEGPAYGAKGASFHDLAGHWWKVYTAMAMGWSDVIVVTPGQLKKFATGSGASNKEAVMLAAVRRWPDLNITGNDTADAAVLMQMGRALTGEDMGMPKANMEALKGLEVNEKVVILG
ncbi:holiday junction resolvase [Nocardia phage KYD2]|nr:holiday junction resolvase [Nocardia phage KYD2]